MSGAAPRGLLCCPNPGWDTGEMVSCDSKFQVLGQREEVKRGQSSTSGQFLINIFLSGSRKVDLVMSALPMTSRFLCFLWMKSEIHSHTLVPKQSLNNAAFIEVSHVPAAVGFKGYRCPLGAVRDSGCSFHLFGEFFYCLICIPTQPSAPSRAALLLLVCFTGN